MTVNLLANATTPVDDPGGALTIAFEFALGFTCSRAQFLREIRWYRANTGGSRAPTTLRVWDTTTLAVVAAAPTVPDDGAAGWQSYPLATQVQLVANREYRVSGFWPVGRTIPVITSNAVGTPPAPLAFAAVYRDYNTTNPGYPATSPYTTAVAVDVGVDDSPPEGAPPPATEGDVNNALADWLDTSDGTQANSAPLLTYQAVTDGDTGLAAISANLGDIMGSSWSSAADTLHQIGSKVASILTKVTDGPLPGIAGLEALANTILDTLEAAANYLVNPTGGGAGALANSPPLPGAGWAMVGEADFEDCDTITVQCHLIVLDFTSFPVSRPAHNVCGVPIRYRLGWWCPMNGDFAGARQFIDFEKMHVQDGGRLMSGALIVCEPGTSGHWQAWLLS